MTSNKNKSNSISMSDSDQTIVNFQKKKLYYENKIFGFLKAVIRCRSSLQKTEQEYNEKDKKQSRLR